jgi:alanyl-tRNA synthetase
MGFERVCAVLQKKNSNYDTDVFTPIIKSVEKLSGVSYKKDLSAADLSKAEKDMIAMRVIADHIRTLTFAIADGATPSNEGRGYVLRRLLRRAARYGRKINLKDPFLYKLVAVVVNNFSNVFPEIKTNQPNIEKIIKAEEESFNATLDRGIRLFYESLSDLIIKQINTEGKYVAEQIITETSFNIILYRNKSESTTQSEEFSIGNLIRHKSNEININNWNHNFSEKYLDITPKLSGDDVFKLYDTFGFPVDLTAVMAREQGFEIDEVRFNKLMNEQKERARKGRKEITSSAKISFDASATLTVYDKTEFTGYDELKTEATIIQINNSDSQTFVVLDKSPFYVESGGQVGDNGFILVGDKQLRVIDLAKVNNYVVHIVDNNANIKLENGMKVIAQVDEIRRWDIMRNHSATHFLHKALRQILGQHVQQSGSYVGPDYLRFDFTHFEKVKESELEAIESLVNEKIRENLPLIHHRDTPFEEAKKLGALMFFGDKYGDKVNVVQFGDFTMEFCGGTHVQNSSQIGLFKIVSESSIASGVRRIEAVTGAGVEKFIKEQECRVQNAERRVNEILDEKKKLEKELADLKLKEKLSGLDAIILSPSEVNGIKIFKGKVSASNMDELKSMGDELREKMKSGVGVLISQIEDKVGIVAVVSDDLIKEKKILAGNIVKEVAKIVGGSGGGRPHLATAGGKDVEKIDDALNSLEKLF